MSGNTPAIFRIIIPVADVAEASDFYSRLLDLIPRAVGGGRVYFDCGPVILAILQSEKGPLPEYIYFSVSDLESIFERAVKMDCISKDVVHGAPAGEIVTRPWRERSFYAYDPTGNGLCFVDEKTLFTGC